jgi:peptidoglycan/LPS O-acetylase OafA/YrhL
MAGGREPALDGLRGVAALVVLFSHMACFWSGCIVFALSQGATRPDGPIETVLFDTPLRLLWQGHSAVIVFFVLSGFVLAQPWVTGNGQRWGVFVVRRIARVYLPYLAALSLTLLLRQAAGHDWLPNLGYLVNTTWEKPITSTVVLHHLAMDGRESTLDPPIWSLVWEMRVSMIFPLLVWPAVLLGLPGLSVVLAGLLVAGASAAPWADDAERMAGTAMLFVFGIGLAFRAASVVPWLSRRLPATVVLLAGLALVGPFWSRDVMLDMLPLGVGSLLLIAAALMEGAVRRALLSGPAQWLGRVSYSLYLIHLPIMLAVVRLMHGRAPLLVLVTAGAGLALIASVWFQRAIEAPCQRLGRRLTARSGEFSRA